MGGGNSQSEKEEKIEPVCADVQVEIRDAVDEDGNQTGEPPI